MVIEETTQPKKEQALGAQPTRARPTRAQPKNEPVKPAKSILKKSRPKRAVILAPDLHEAILDSIQEAQEGKTLSHAEVLRRNGS